MLSQVNNRKKLREQGHLEKTIKTTRLRWYMFTVIFSSNFEPVIEHFLKQTDTYHYSNLTLKYVYANLFSKQ